MTCKVVCLLPTTSHICHEEHSSRYCLSMSPSHPPSSETLNLAHVRTNTVQHIFALRLLMLLGHKQQLPLRAADKQCACEHSKGAIYDLCKTRFTSRVGGYNGYLSLCGYSFCFVIVVMAAKLRYVCEMTKGMGKIFKGGGSREMLNV